MAYAADEERVPAGSVARKKRGNSLFSNPQLQRSAEYDERELQQNGAKVQAFFSYLRLEDGPRIDRCLGRTGKSPQCLLQAPDGGPKAVHPAVVASKARGHNKHRKRNTELRRAKTEALRKEAEGLSDESVMERVEDVFIAYSDKLRTHSAGRHVISCVGWCRLLRDCRLLGPRVTLVVADVIFTQLAAGADPASIPKDLHHDYEGFLQCLRRLISHRTKTCTSAEAALRSLARTHLLPFHHANVQLQAADGLFVRPSLNLVRTFDAQLKRLFAWYATLEETNPSRVTWEGVLKRATRLGSSDFALLLLNFEVLPALLSKHEAVDVFLECEEDEEGEDGQSDAMAYPAFLETLAMVALRVGDHMPRRIRAAASPDDVKLLRRYVTACPSLIRHGLAKAFDSRGGSSGTGTSHGGGFGFGVAGSGNFGAAGGGDDGVEGSSPPRAMSPDAYERAGENLAVKTELASRKRVWDEQIVVVLRREEVRQHFAEARLRNFYRDVRTLNNNSVWPPPEKDAGSSGCTNQVAFSNGGGNRLGPASNGQGGSGSGSVWADPLLAMAGDEQHVAFFSDQRQIKTPQPKWLPSAHHHLESSIPPRRSVTCQPPSTSSMNGPLSARPGHPSNPNADNGGGGVSLSASIRDRWHSHSTNHSRSNSGYNFNADFLNSLKAEDRDEDPASAFSSLLPKARVGYTAPRAPVSTAPMAAAAGGAAAKPSISHADVAAHRSPVVPAAVVVMQTGAAADAAATAAAATLRQAATALRQQQQQQVARPLGGKVSHHNGGASHGYGGHLHAQQSPAAPPAGTWPIQPPADFHLQVQIEDRDEAEAITELSRRLPTLLVGRGSDDPMRGRSGSYFTHGRSMDDSPVHGAAGGVRSPSTPVTGSGRRAATAPTELGRAQVGSGSRGGAPNAVGAAGRGCGGNTGVVGAVATGSTKLTELGKARTIGVISNGRGGVGAARVASSQQMRRDLGFVGGRGTNPANPSSAFGTMGLPPRPVMGTCTSPERGVRDGGRIRGACKPVGVGEGGLPGQFVGGPSVAALLPVGW